jgi:hypothetical protein
MTPRPSPKPRPLSAIYIGPNPSPNSIPDLPEPPSPGGSSNGSGLPSPPATNSTGSGSTGDNTTNTGRLRQKPATNMLNGGYGKTSSNGALARIPGNGRIDEEDVHDHDNEDEDSTARLGRQTRRVTSENVLALQRVKSLTQRNRMVSAAPQFSRHRSILLTPFMLLLFLSTPRINPALFIVDACDCRKSCPASGT